MMDTFQNFAPDDPFGAIEEQARGRILPKAAREWFIEQGVPPVNLVKTWAGYSDLVLYDDVVFLDNGCFEFHRYKPGKADAALTFVCWSSDGCASDICAWQAKTGKIATWLGYVAMLGEENLYGPRPDVGLMVHVDPLDWFKAKRSGVVILNSEWAAPALRDAGTLATSSLAAARTLRRALVVEMPKILIPDDGESA
jgi:hypothetical protein